MYSTVACIGLPAALRNPVAAALVLSWLVGEMTWMVTGNNLPISVYFMADIFVIAVIYAKMIRRCGPKAYASMRDQFRCFVTDLTRCDRWIAALFLLGAWPLYVLEIHPFYKWWLLWAITIAQFLLAGAEAALSFRHDVKARATDPPDNGLALAGLWRNG